MATNGTSHSPPLRINLIRPSHVYYRHRDIDAARVFMEDFGLLETVRAGSRTYYRGYGTEPFVVCLEAAGAKKKETEEEGRQQEQGPAFGGGAFVVESIDDLIRASKSLPPACRATGILDMGGAPGGGKRVTFYDPVDGFPFHLVYDQQPIEALEPPRLPELKVNYPVVKNRPPNQSLQFEKRPAPVHKLGHFGMCVTDFATSYEFYTTYFNFYPSEIIHNASGVDKTVFFRLDRGNELVDHHCFFLYEGVRAHVHHSSFETHDLDTQVLGHDWLRHRGYKNCWGVGRHLMGSQIFDYWFDTSGFILEHYADGDLVDMAEPTRRHVESPSNLSVWGPDVPPNFLH